MGKEKEGLIRLIKVREDGKEVDITPPPVHVNTRRLGSHLGEPANYSSAMAAHRILKAAEVSEKRTYACFEAGRSLGTLSDEWLIDKIVAKYGEGVRPAVFEVISAWRIDPENFGKNIGPYARITENIRKHIQEDIAERKEKDDAD
ncbi:MAG: hypothetical protein QG620_28 [Patescibacteria group bacterium]|nr:hypothetical protein [Patescibacteria group bacterium]